MKKILVLAVLSLVFTSLSVAQKVSYVLNKPENNLPMQTEDEPTQPTRPNSNASPKKNIPAAKPVANTEKIPSHSKNNLSLQAVYDEIIPNPDGSVLITEYASMYAKQTAFDELTKVFHLFHKNAQDRLTYDDIQILEVTKNGESVPYTFKGNFATKTLTIGNVLRAQIEGGQKVNYKIKYMINNFITVDKNKK
jgi:hypothetical protein